MAQFADIEGLRQATSLQTALVWREVRLTEDAIRQRSHRRHCGR